MKFTPRVAALSVALAIMTLTACSKDKTAEQAAAAQQMPPATVDVQIIELGAIPLTQTFSGRTAAFESSEVRPQATGIIDEILFQEGSMVQAGQPLYRINMDSYTSSVAANEAALNQARANIGTARANLAAQQAVHEQARADLARLSGLLEVDAISKQAYDQAVTNVKTTRAAIEQAQANLASSEATLRSAEAALSGSRLDLNRTIVRSPITGRSGISSVTKGALVASGQAAALVTISRLDPIYVDISQSSSEILKIRQQLASGEASQGSAEVRLVLEDGTTYPATGQITLANAQVDEATGSVTLRAVFPNPDGILLPGMYVNAELSQSVAQNAALLPQTAVMRTPKGETQVYIVNESNQIELRDIVTAGTHNGQWVVTGGLKTGDKVVVLGGNKVKPEQQVEVRVLGATSGTGETSEEMGEVAGQNSVLAPQNPQLSEVEADTRSGQSEAPAPTQPQAQAQAQPQAQAQAKAKPQAQASQSTEPKPAQNASSQALSPEEAEALAAADEAQ